MKVEQLRLQVHPGNGLVAHVGAAVVVVPEASARPAFLDALLEVVTSASAAYGPSPGRQLIRKVAGLVTAADQDAVGAFAVLASEDDGLALMLCGSMDMRLTGLGGELEVLSGRDVATWVDRVIRSSFDRLVLVPEGITEPDLDPRTDLQAGLVTGSGCSLSFNDTAPTGQPTSGRTPRPTVVGAPVLQNEAVAGEQPAPVLLGERRGAQERLVATPPGPPAALEVTIPPERAPSRSGFVSIKLSDPLPPEELRPLPVATARPADSGAASAPADSPSADRSPIDPAASVEGTVHGILCSRDHFNDPNARFCAVCGIAMVQQSHYLTTGVRPPLGVLVLDDGASFVVDQDLVIGREPETSELVRTGEARALTISDPELRLSRVHARVLLRDWEVHIEDAGSANGTRILRPGASEWTRLAPREAMTMTSGTRIGMGDRELVFDSHFRAR